MKHLLSVAIIGLVGMTSPAAAQSLRFGGMVSTDSKFEQFAVSAVSSPVASLALGKSLSVDGVILPSVIVDKKLEVFQPALGVGAVVHVAKLDLGVAAFKQGDGWVNHYGLVVRF